VVLEPKTKFHPKVTAILANHQRRDLTGQVRFESLNREIFNVADDGTLEAGSPGEASLLVHAIGGFRHAEVAVVRTPQPAAKPLPEHNLIDRVIFAKLRQTKIPASDLASDSEFLRRVCLDLTGMLPPPARVRTFLADKSPDKRDRLIDA